MLNSVLNGIEHAVLNELPTRYTTSSGKIVMTKVKIIRFINDLILIGKGDSKLFDQIYERVISFVESRGLCFTGRKEIISFVPGACFEYRGFSFIHPKASSRSFRCKFTVGAGRGQLSSLLVLIQNKSMKKCGVTIRALTNSSRAALPLGGVIEKINR